MRLSRRWCALLIPLAATVLPAGAGGASSRGWSPARQLVAANLRTFSPQLAVNHAGAAVAAWFAGPPPPVYSGPPPVPTGPKWTGNQIVVALGSINHGLATPRVIAHDGTDVEDQITVALSGAGVAYVAWLRSDGPGAMIVTARGGHLSSPRRLALPPGAQFDRLVSGLDGPVDALSVRPNGHGVTFFCTALEPGGRSGHSLRAIHPYKPNPCELPDTSDMTATAPPDSGHPPGYRRAPDSLVSRSNGTSHALAIWDDWRDTGPAFTYGLFYAVRNS